MVYESAPLAKELGLTIFCLAFINAGLQLCDEEVGTEASVYELDHTTIKKCVDQCAHFCHFQAVLLGECDREQAGIDFWLTRNGHGTGFWDREEVYGDVNAQRLSDACGEYGACDFMRGDTQRIYLEGTCSYFPE